jgi:hypothetical protein
VECPTAPVINVYKNGSMVAKIGGYNKDFLEKKVKSMMK